MQFFNNGLYLSPLNGVFPLVSEEEKNLVTPENLTQTFLLVPAKLRLVALGKLNLGSPVLGKFSVLNFLAENPRFPKTLGFPF